MFVRYLSLHAVAAGAGAPILELQRSGEKKKQINDYYYLFQCVAISRQSCGIRRRDGEEEEEEEAGAPNTVHGICAPLHTKR